MSMFALVAFGLVGIGLLLAKVLDRLDNIARLLGNMIDYEAQSASSLRSINHDTNIMRENTPRIEHDWEHDLAEHPQG